MAVVFCKLIVRGQDEGIHALVVPLRDYSTHNVLAGITIGDCGKKGGVDNIDNGYIIFKDYQVPYDALLDKFSYIN